MGYPGTPDYSRTSSGLSPVEQRAKEISKEFHERGLCRAVEFLIRRIAELEIKIEELEEKQKTIKIKIVE